MNEEDIINWVYSLVKHSDKHFKWYRKQHPEFVPEYWNKDAREHFIKTIIHLQNKKRE